MSYKKRIDGFERFRKDYSETSADYKKLLEEGQKPDILVIACSDSRIDPAILTRSDLGELFAVRNIAALVPPYTHGEENGTRAAIEYAVRSLRVRHIVVLGHAGCGGIRALATGDPPHFQFLHPWLQIGLEAKQALYSTLKNAPKSEKIKALEQAAIVLSLENLFSFPWIKAKHDDLHLHGWYFDLKECALLEYNPQNAEFENIALHTEALMPFNESKGLQYFLKTQSKKGAKAP